MADLYDSGIPARDEHQSLGNHAAGRLIEALAVALDEDIDDLAATIAAAVGTLVGSGVESLDLCHDDPGATQAFLVAVMGEIQFYLDHCRSDKALIGFLDVQPT